MIFILATAKNRENVKLCGGILERRMTTHIFNGIDEPILCHLAINCSRICMSSSGETPYFPTLLRMRCQKNHNVGCRAFVVKVSEKSYAMIQQLPKEQPIC